MARKTTPIPETQLGRQRMRNVNQREAMVAKTVKLPVSIDERLRKHCFETRRSGQEIMLEAVQTYLDALNSREKA